MGFLGGGKGRSLQGVGYFLSNSTRNYDLVAISSSASLLDKVQVLVCLDWKLYSAWPCVYTIATHSFDTHSTSTSTVTSTHEPGIHPQEEGIDMPGLVLIHHRSHVRPRILAPKQQLPTSLPTHPPNNV